MSGYQSKKLAARIMPKPKVMDRKQYAVKDTTTVDNSTWYTITCTLEVAKWIRETYSDSNDDKWYEHKNINTWGYRQSVFDIHEKIYTMLSLKWE